MAKWCEKDKCGKYVVRRLPVLDWLPRYKPTWILQDALAGITVGLTAVPQGIAYGIVAGLNPENVPGRRTGTIFQKIGWLLGLSRNALVVIVGIIMAYSFDINGLEPFQLTGTMGQGLPPFTPPPFSTTFQNQTYNFLNMTTAMGTTLFTIPIVSTIEHIAIAKAFAKGKSLDATQEMIALGVCNIFGSFVRSMPVTGSFTRTAVNYASGVKTPLGGIFTGGLVLLALSLLTSTFRFIPKATLAGLIICAMYYMLDFSTYSLLWHARKIDFCVMMLTLLPSVFLGLEYGILIGIVVNLVALLYFSARPSIQTKIQQIEGETVIVVIPEEAIAFPAAEHLRANIMKLSGESGCNVIFDCKNLKRLDVTVAKNVKLLGKDLSVRGQTIVCSNCCENVNAILKVVAPELLNVKEDRSDHDDNHG